MAKVSIDEALDDCLQRLPHEGLDACLRRYPEYADELRGLLQVGVMVSRTSAATVLSDEARQRMRAQLFKPAPALTANPVVPDQAAQPTRVLPLPTTQLRPMGRGALFSHPLVRAALVLLILAALFLGGSAASAHTSPGDALYPVKRLYEGIRYTFSLSDSDKANARLDFASARLDEMEALVQSKGTIDADLLTDLTGNVSYCSDELNSSSFSAKQQLASAFGTLLQREQQVLGAVSSEVSANAQSLYTMAKQSIVPYYKTVTRYAPTVPPLANPVGLPTTVPGVTPGLPTVQNTATVLPNGATPSDTVVLTGTATVPTNIPTNTPTVLPTNTVQPSLTNAAQPSPTNAGRHNGPTNTPLPTTPRPRTSDTPLPAYLSPTPTNLPAPTATHPPIKLRPTPTFKPTFLPTVIVPPTPNPTTIMPPIVRPTATAGTAGSKDSKGKGKGKGDGGDGNGQGGNGQGNGS